MNRLLCVAVALSGCFHPTYDDPMCGPGATCPTGLKCVASVCVSQAVTDSGLSGEVVIGGIASLGGQSGPILEDNGGDDRLVTAGGRFAFTTLIPKGSPYNVTVSTQPTNPSQTCTVANGSGTATSEVSDVAVNCTLDTFTVGGTVAEFAVGGGNNVVLTNNGIDDMTIAANGAFTFSIPVASGHAYDVRVKSQSGEACSSVANVGTVGNGTVSTVVLICGGNSKYIVGGMFGQGGVTGLNGLVKLHNGTDTITVNGDGPFAFPTPIQGGGTNTYAVTVTQQPAYPPAAQNCTVTNGSGTVGATNVANVNVACTTKSFSIGGGVSGLTGSLILSNGGEMLTVSANGAFAFTNKVVSGSTYAVDVYTQPERQLCTVGAGTGTVENSDRTNVSVTCKAL